MFYSNTLFKGEKTEDGKDKGLNPEQITAVICSVNFVATLVGLGFSFRYGRKTLMFVGSAGMTLDLALIGVFGMLDSSSAMLMCVIIFICLFECSIGPILWLYMAETMQDKAISIATALNWVMNLIVAIITPIMIPQDSESAAHDTVPFIFISCAVLTALCTVFVGVFMIETRGKSPQEI